MNSSKHISKDDFELLIEEIRKMKTSVDININIQLVNQNIDNNVSSIVNTTKTVNSRSSDSLSEIVPVNNKTIEFYVHKFRYGDIELNQISTNRVPLIEIHYTLRDDIKSGILIEEFINYDMDMSFIELNILDISGKLIYINTIDYEINRIKFENIIQIYKIHKFTKLICVNNLYMCKITNTDIIRIINYN
jgi:hypothetical protein